MILSRLQYSLNSKPIQLFELIARQRTSAKHLSTQTASTVQAETNEQPGQENESKWGGKNAWKVGLFSISLMAASGLGMAYSTWGPPPRDESGIEIKDKYSDMNILVGYTCRTFSNMLAFKDSIKDPVSDKLLPDPLQPPYFQPKYTLVIEATNIMVHPDWKFRSGWRFKKRPALEMFLQQLSPYFEVVCFTNENIMTMAPVLQQLDPKGELIHYRLFRDATRYRNGVHYKDLSCLNRDLSKVILVDFSKDATSLQPGNALVLKPWTGDDSDRDLIDLAAFLRMIAMSGVDDVRPALENYMQHDNPLALFRERHQMLMDLEAEKRKEAQQKKSTLGSKKFSFSSNFR